MVERTCEQCSAVFTTRARTTRFCSLTCNKQWNYAHAEHCTLDDCDKPQRARGLCATHYNQQHHPNRHATKAVPCDQCGALCMKQPTGKFAHRFCSLACRDAWRLTHPLTRVPTRCPVPKSHPVRMLMDVQERRAQAAERAVREARARQRQADLDARLSPRPCADCATVFKPYSTGQLYCGRQCQRRVGRRVRRAAESNAHGSFTWSDFMTVAQRFDFCCAYCGVKSSRQLDPDHVVPLSRGGANTVSNLLPSCNSCNGDKRDLLLDEWATDRKQRGKPPRITSWDPGDRRYWHLADARLAAAA